MQERKNIVEAFSELSPKYERVVDRELTAFWGWSYTEFLDEMLAGLEIGADERVLDIATGTGAIPRALRALNGDYGRIVGLDITPAVLTIAQHKAQSLPTNPGIDWVCGSALDMPYQQGAFSLVLCGLATHHMDVERLLSEIARVIEPAGRLTIADVGASNLWRLPLVKPFLRLAAFLYFMVKDGKARAWIESAAVGNVRTANQWRELVSNHGFTDINVTEMVSRRVWSPSPLLIRATIPDR